MGGAFLVETREDLERASRTVPGASGLESAGPAGGQRVSFRDPNGIQVSLVWGLDGKPIEEDLPMPKVNFPKALEKPRKGEFRRWVVETYWSSRGIC